MKIILATPLYPPDVEPIATYNKELARRLSTQKHNVVVTTYGKYPERLDGVLVVTTDKEKFSLVRIIYYTAKLWKMACDFDVIYVQNGASVELPIIIVTSIVKKPFVFFETDKNAQKRTRENFFLNIIHEKIIRRALITIKEIPSPKPEILPFASYPEKELLGYEKEWSTHIETLSKIII